MDDGDQFAKSCSRAVAVVRNAVLMVRFLRMPILMTLMAGLVLVLPEQTIEVYRSIAQDVLFIEGDMRAKIELGLASVGLVAMGVAIWYVAALLGQRLGHRVSSGTRLAMAWMPNILVIVLFTAAAAGVFCAQTEEPTDDARAAALTALQYRLDLATAGVTQRMLSVLFSYNEYLRDAAILIIVVGIVLAASLPRLKANTPRSGASCVPPLFHHRASVLIYAVIAAIVMLFIISPVTLPRTVGTLAVFSIFIVCLAVVLGQLGYWSDTQGIPYFLILLLVVVALSLTDANDDHWIYRSAPREGGKSAQTSGVASPLSVEFQRWWKSRMSERARYEQHNRPYPIYVVAAQGGGIYAAAHTVSMLGALQHRCPAFARHLFAISGVSGGSLGAAGFLGLLKQTGSAASTSVGPVCHDRVPAYKDSLIDLGDQLENEDLLSPLLAALIFPDLIQRFLPFPISALDRARRLEWAFEQALDNVMADLKKSNKPLEAFGPNFLRTPFSDHWSPEGNTPALVINTTEVGSGRRRVIAPFEFAGHDLLFLPIASEAGGLRTLSVSTAAILSARFPWITPAGTFYDFERNEKVRLVDGGYFENSGVATAIDLIRALESSAEEHGFADKIRIHLIVLTRGDYPKQKFFGLNEALSPVQALLSTRTSRAYITIAEAARELNGPQAQISAMMRLRKINLLDMGYPPPLGWRLSAVTMLLIQAQNGMGSECKPGGADPQSKLNRFEAFCLLDVVARELQSD
jgi:hypothetical protein